MNRTNPIDSALFTAALDALHVLHNVRKLSAIITKDDSEPVVISQLERAMQDAEKEMEANIAVADDNISM